MVPDVEEASSKVVQEEPGEDHNQSVQFNRSSSDSGPRSLKNRQVDMMQKLRGNPTVSVETMRSPSLWQQLLAEIVGTTIYVAFGLSAVSAATVAGALDGMWQVLVIWAISIAMGIISSISISGGHLNPAISFTFALLRPELFPWWKVVPYWIAQLIGGMLGGGMNYLAYGTAITAVEKSYGIVRGQPGSELTASLFHGLYPSPASLLNTELGWSENTVTAGGAFGVEFFGSAFLVFIVFTLMDPRNHLHLSGGCIAFTIGLSVAVLGCIYAPLEGLGINPARDLGPRIVAYSLGWGEIAIPGPNNSMWIWIIAPMLGGPVGGIFYDWIYTHGL
ncbi:Aquaporin-3 [Hondaea fermentalgiana]|uniref:Aquaporin-3 n=1 Tax=Hondaea fermentalgiana TaxID=2315210 RepID=A0A2R5G6G0_9STRA|nr:Aquaporin-3 [Hondaea fermentalgiana]|eukprot:GBG26642.1 Aquaporin-3 [Hondaea fermentalgiana]